MRVHNDYRALMVILQSHRTQNMILRCYPNVSAILWRYAKSCLLCFFNNPYNNFPLLIHRIFYLLVSALFLHALQYLKRAFNGALLRPKNGYLVRSRGASSARARRAQAQNMSCRVQSAERVARRQLA